MSERKPVALDQITPRFHLVWPDDCPLPPEAREKFENQVRTEIHANARYPRDYVGGMIFGNWT